MSELTIGVPVYNSASTVGATLEGLLGQTDQDFGILVSDNASVDETPIILERYARRHSRISVVRQASNIGSSANFWYLIQAATTPLFGWCAADDVPQAAYIERCRQGLIAAPGAMLCCSDIIFVLASGERFQYYENLDTVGCNVDARMHRLMSRLEWYATYGIGWRDRLASCGPPGTRYGNDVTWTAEWLCRWEIACIHEPLLHLGYGPRDVARYAEYAQDKGPIAERPLSQMLGDIGAAVQRRARPDQSPQRLIGTMARTLAFENQTLANTILAEHRLAPEDLDLAARFKFFQTLLLAQL